MLEAKGLGDLPKCLAPVAGRPFLYYVLDHLVQQKIIDRVVLCVGPWYDEILSSISDSPYYGIEIVYSKEDAPLGTGGALKHALPLLDSDPVLVLNGDTFCKFDLTSLLEELIVRKARVWYSKEFVNTGVRLITKQFIKSLPNTCALDDEIGKLLLFDAIHGTEEFLDIGTPEGYAQAGTFLRDQGMVHGTTT